MESGGPTQDPGANRLADREPGRRLRPRASPTANPAGADQSQVVNRIDSTPRTGALVALIAITMAALLLLLAPGHAAAGSGGLGTEPPSGGKAGHCRGKGKARLLDNGKARAPRCAPRRVKRAIRAANKISRTKYRWGGGHASFQSRGYDCSGAVSFMLHGGGLLRTPLTSGSLARWGRKRRGDWITIYANAGHVYAVVAGLRWDTSGGPGPRWHSDMRSPRGFKTRHPRGL